MPSGAFQRQASGWLAENRPAKLQLLFRATVCHPSASILIGDNDRHFHHACSGSGKLPGFARDEIIGRSSDNFIEPDFKPPISAMEKSFLQREEHGGTLRFVGVDGSPREAEYIAKGSVLPVRNLLALCNKTVESESEGNAEGASGEISGMGSRHFNQKVRSENEQADRKDPVGYYADIGKLTWPDNVGEIENFIERAVVLSRGPKLCAPVGEFRADPVALPGSGPGQGLAYA